jgi:ADP-ribose pyrophosphatase YjhB (NUDIX family)
MNIAKKVGPDVYLRTVSGLFCRTTSNGAVLIGIHWPKKAALAEESNLSPVAGPWEDGESAEAAIRRRLKAEYGLLAVADISPLQHGTFASETNRKQYFWLLVKLEYPVPDIVANTREVASFGWYNPSNLESAIALMHREKQLMFKEVLKIAINIEPDLRPFKKDFG